MSAASNEGGWPVDGSAVYFQAPEPGLHLQVEYQPNGHFLEVIQRQQAELDIERRRNAALVHLAREKDGKAVTFYGKACELGGELQNRDVAMRDLWEINRKLELSEKAAKEKCAEALEQNRIIGEQNRAIHANMEDLKTELELAKEEISKLKTENETIRTAHEKQELLMCKMSWLWKPDVENRSEKPQKITKAELPKAKRAVMLLEKIYDGMDREEKEIFRDHFTNELRFKNLLIERVDMSKRVENFEKELRYTTARNKVFEINAQNDKKLMEELKQKATQFENENQGMKDKISNAKARSRELKKSHQKFFNNLEVVFAKLRRWKKKKGANAEREKYNIFEKDDELRAVMKCLKKECRAIKSKNRKQTKPSDSESAEEAIQQPMDESEEELRDV